MHKARFEDVVIWNLWLPSTFTLSGKVSEFDWSGHKTMLGKVAYILLPIPILYLMEFFKSLSEITKHSITQISNQIQMFCYAFT